MGNRNIIFRVILGGYLAYLGITLVKDAVIDKPDNYVGFMLAGIAFIVIGGGFLIYSVRNHLKEKEKEQEEVIEDEDEENIVKEIDANNEEE